MPTHGPAIVNGDGVRSGASEPTDSTYCCHHDGIDTAVTPDQLRGSRAEPDRRVDWCRRPHRRHAARMSPAAATITASFSTAAYLRAAPSSVWSMFLSRACSVTAEMLMTRAPMSAARTIARASVYVERRPRSTGSSPGLRGAYRAEVCRIEQDPCRGRHPRETFGAGLARDQSRDESAVAVAVGEAVGDSTKSPPGSTFGQPRARLAPRCR